MFAVSGKDGLNMGFAIVVRLKIRGHLSELIIYLFRSNILSLSHLISTGQFVVFIPFLSY